VNPMGVLSKGAGLWAVGGFVAGAGFSEISNKCPFPLPRPVPEAHPFADSKVSEARAASSRSLRRKAVFRRVVESVDCLNDVYGSRVDDSELKFGSSFCPGSPAPPNSSPSHPASSSQGSPRITSAQARILQRIYDTHRSARPPSGRCIGQEALGALIKARDLYSLEKVATAPYSRDLLNIFRGGRRPLVDLSSTLPADEKCWWQDPDRFLLEDPDVADSASAEIPEPYWDPILKNNRVAYREFLQDLDNAGVLQYRRRSRCKIGIFFVRKSNGDLRMVVDCRQANCRFRKPPKTRLVSGSTFGELLLPSGETLFISGADVIDCFYSFSCGDLNDMFCLNEVRASEVGVTSIGGVPVGKDEWIFPSLSVLPMGFNWALHFAQAAVQQVRRDADPHALDVQDGEIVPLPMPQSVLASTYVDNLLAISRDASSLQRHHEMVMTHFDKNGLALHQAFVGEQVAETLGYRLGGEPPAVANADKRVWRFLEAVRFIRGSGFMSGDLMDVVLGHYTSLSLIVRGLLSVPEACYKFARETGSRWVRIPWSVSRELKWMVGLLPLGVVGLDAGVDSVFTASDASGEDGGWGYAVVESKGDPALVTDVFRVNERWRFRELFPHEIVKQETSAAQPLHPYGPLPCSEGDMASY
jgi:hypothetical protein